MGLFFFVPGEPAAQLCSRRRGSFLASLSSLTACAGRQYLHAGTVWIRTRVRWVLYREPAKCPRLRLVVPSRLSFSIRELAHELNVPLVPTQTSRSMVAETQASILPQSCLRYTSCTGRASGRHGASITRIPVPRGPRNPRRGSYAGGSGGTCSLVSTRCVEKLLHPTQYLQKEGSRERDTQQQRPSVATHQRHIMESRPTAVRSSASRLPQ